MSFCHYTFSICTQYPVFGQSTCKIWYTQTVSMQYDSFNLIYWALETIYRRKSNSKYLPWNLMRHKPCPCSKWYAPPDWVRQAITTLLTCHSGGGLVTRHYCLCDYLQHVWHQSKDIVLALVKTCLASDLSPILLLKV